MIYPYFLIFPPSIHHYSGSSWSWSTFCLIVLLTVFAIGFLGFVWLIGSDLYYYIKDCRSKPKDEPSSYIKEKGRDND